MNYWQFFKSPETFLLAISKDEYSKYKKEIKNICGNSWKTFYVTSKDTLIFRQTGKARPTKKRAQAAKDLQKRLLGLSSDFANRMIWGYERSNLEDLFFFPTGKLIVIFKEKVNQKQRRKILSKHEFSKIEMPKDIETTAFKRADSVDTTNKHVRKEKTKKQRKKIAAPIVFLTLPAGKENRAFEIAVGISKNSEVIIAVPDVHLLGKNISTKVLQPFPAPTISSENIIARNLINRAWEMIPSHSNTQYICSSNKVAVFDANFYDHENIRYLIQGYDAEDGDIDPRSPHSPPDIDTNSVYYWHGTMMSGVIGAISEDQELGVAPGSYIVPFRADKTNLAFPDDFWEFLANWMDYWGRALYKLFLLSYQSNGVEVANFSISININSIFLDEIGFLDMFHWALLGGSDGYGIFASVSCGNNSEATSIGYLARPSYVFAVDEGDWETDESLGNNGFGKDILVDTGRWHTHLPNDVVAYWPSRSGGSSLAAAVISGVATLMKIANRLGFTYQILKAQDLRQLLCISTRQSPTHIREANTQGWHPNYGYGFLDAYHAVKLSYKAFRKAVQVKKINYLPSGKPCVLVQASWRIEGTSPPKPSGWFWSLEERPDDVVGYYWKHTKVGDHLDILLSIQKMGEKMTIGDFDGDSSDEIALQGASPTGDPRSFFMVSKFQNDGRWSGLGQGTLTEALMARYICPNNSSISQVFAAKLINDRDALVIRQSNEITVAGYNSTTDRWETISQLTPQLFSLDLVRAAGLDERTQSRILHVAKFKHPKLDNRDSILVIGSVGNPFSPLSMEILTASILVWDSSSSRFVNVSLDNLENTHVLLMEKENFVTPSNYLVGDFDGDNQPEVVIQISKKLIFLDFHYDPSVANSVVGNSVYVNEVIMPLQISSLHHGKIFPGIEQPTSEKIAYLSQTTNGEVVKFISWNPILRDWIDIPVTLSHNRKDNHAIDIVVGDFNDDNRAEIGIKMDLPHQNMFRVYRWEVDPKADIDNPYVGYFKQRGYW